MGCSNNHLSREIKRESNFKLPENSDSEPKNISLQDLLQSNTNFYCQSLELLIAQTIFIYNIARASPITFSIRKRAQNPDSAR